MTALITFVGGGLLLPARTPYDRQVLREHVLNRARNVEQLQVKVGRKTWLVDRPHEQRPLVCGLCKRQLTVAALHAPPSENVYCVACALR
jgi:hypothetical protein